ncbi:hypothetical protein ACFL5G_02875 [Candidatus Margulisiibacteriota bacterium]
MKKSIIIILLIALFCTPLSAAERISTGEITGSTVLAGLASLILWPGIGQAINEDAQDKVVWHAVFGLIDVATRVPVVRLWSGYDGLVDRKGGYLDGKL